MRIEAPKKLFNVDEYYRMADVGIIQYGDRLELIDGEIIEMAPIGDHHAGCVNRAGRLLHASIADRATISVQNPLRLNNYTEPQPDVVVLKFREDCYSRKRPMAEDTLLVIEVSDTTLRYDRNVKVPRYARSGVPEVWIECLEEESLLVFREPSGDGYRNFQTLGRSDSVYLAAFPDIVFKVADLLC